MRIALLTKGGDPELFTLIVEAYESLSDPKRRRAYDEEKNE